MPVELLDLPEEVLNACIGELLPPLREIGTEWIVDYYTLVQIFLMDLLNLRLTCSLLYHLATPFVWRRLDIHLETRALEHDGPSHDHPIALRKWRPLLDQPEVAKHVRFFSLTSSLTQGDELRPALTALIPLVRMMNNLRAVRVQITPMRNPTEVNEISTILVADLLSKPGLHTAIVRCLAIPPPSALRSLANVKRLHISDNTWVESLLPTTPRLEVLSFCGPLDSNASSLPIPWNTLRELEAYGVEDWTHIIDNYTVWKERNPTEFSPLAELSIYRASLNVDMIHRILAVFGEQKLIKLKLSGKVYVDKSILRSLLATFPLLEDLNLITDMFNVDWKTELSDISKIFGRYPALKDFTCSYAVETPERGIYIPDSDEEEGSVEANRLIPKLAKIVASLGKNTRNLTHVQFFYRYDESFSFEIERDGEGGYKTSYLIRLHSIEYPYTSGWHLKNFNDL